jgi:hypothetical protein
MSYPCLAITTYRLALNYTLQGAVDSTHRGRYIHLTSIDIHPGAKIGDNFSSTGTGVVIGNRRNRRQRQTLSRRHFEALDYKDEGQHRKGRKRHPQFGSLTHHLLRRNPSRSRAVIGDNVVIGGNVWLTGPVIIRHKNKHGRARAEIQGMENQHKLEKQA